MESISEVENELPILKAFPLYTKDFKSHLLQSQIRLIEAVIEEMKSKLRRVEDGKDALEQFGIQWLNKPIEDQISSLNKTLEFIKKSL